MLTTYVVEVVGFVVEFDYPLSNNHYWALHAIGVR